MGNWGSLVRAYMATWWTNQLKRSARPEQWALLLLWFGLFAAGALKPDTPTP